MTDVRSKQSLHNDKNFSTLVLEMMTERGWTASELALRSNLSRTTINRILRNSNDKGSTYQPTENIVAAIAVALQIGEYGYDELVLAAFPERRIWREALRKQSDVLDTNIMLYDAGLPLLGNAKTE